MQKERSRINKGFSLVEILVAMSVFLVFAVATIGIIASLSKNVRHAANNERAAILADEGIEVVRNLRDANLTFATLPSGTYGLSSTSNQWNLSGSSDTVGIFTRSITISTINGSQKKGVVNVSWADQASAANSISASTYFTDWHAPLNIGLTVDKTVINHGGARVPSDFLPVNLTTLAWDSSVDPPVQTSVDIPIVFSPSTMTLAPGTYTFTTSNDSSYSVTLSPVCTGNSITLADGDAKLCSITYEEYTTPTVATPTVASVGTSTASLGANVTSLGNPAPISVRGTCWGTTSAPTSNCLAQTATTTGVFTQARTGFAASTTYYYRGYAINSFGTGYSSDGTFSTASNSIVPTINTPIASSITSTAATLGATVQSLGTPATISARGVCYSTALNPSLTNGATCIAGTLSQTTPGAFTISATSLTPNTTYNYRGYATNSAGTGYTTNATFTPASTITFIASAASSGTTATIPAHNVGDLLIVYAYRDGSATAPIIPAGWTSISNAGGANTNSSAVAYRVATGADPSGTWTNATEIIVTVYRGVAASPIGANVGLAGSGTTATYSALTPTITNGTSWIIGFGGSRAVNSSIEGSPTGMTRRTTFVDATAEVSGHDTNAGASTWPLRTVSIGGGNTGWMTRVLEIKSQ